MATTSINIDTRAGLEEAGRAGNDWLQRLEPVLTQLKETTVVAINLESGEYITAPTRLDALDRFEERFGKFAIGFMHEIGRPVFIGGGIV
jgi:hypothetical protein